MKEKKIKVIKKNELNRLTETPSTNEKDDLRQARREMISTVSGWVDESQKLRAKNSKSNLSQLFASSLLSAHSS